VLSPDQISKAHDAIREMAQEIAIQTDDAESLEHAIQACDRVRMAAQVPEWSREYWLHRAFDAAEGAAEIEPAWTSLASRISMLLACQQGIALA
jgi:hypothetical protein